MCPMLPEEDAYVVRCDQTREHCREEMACAGNGTLSLEVGEHICYQYEGATLKVLGQEEE